MGPEQAGEGRAMVQATRLRLTTGLLAALIAGTPLAGVAAAGWAPAETAPCDLDPRFSVTLPGRDLDRGFLLPVASDSPPGTARCPRIVLLR